MSKSNRIIVGIDGSKYAEAALDKAIELAKFYNTSLYIVNVYNATLQVRDYGQPFSELKVDEKRKSAMVPLLKAYEEKATKAGVQAETNIIVIPGSAGAGLVAEAEDEGAMMIVVGARGLGGIRRMVTGSVSSYVVDHSPCDVLVVKT